MTQTVQYDKNPSAEGAAARVSRVGATPSIATDTATSWPPLGTKSHKLVATATTVATAGLPNADRPAAAAGEKWSLAIDLLNGAASSRQVAASIVFYDTLGSTLGTTLATTSDTRTLNAGQSATFGVDGATAPAGTASVDVQVTRNAGGGAATSDPVYADRVSLTKTPARVAYRDPGTNVLATWSATADASTQVYWDPSFTLTPLPGNAASNGGPCITVQVDDLPVGVRSVTLSRTAAKRTHQVRGAVKLPVSTSFSTQDIEAPFKVPSTYRAELFTVTGASAGSTAQSAAATLDPGDVTWVHNPLDPAGATQIDLAGSSARSVKRPVTGARFQPEARSLGVLITGRRRGVEGVNLLFETDNATTAEKFDAMFGGYTDDDQLPPVIVVRTSQYLDLPTPFFAGVLEPEKNPINVHMGGSLRQWPLQADETAPPFAGIVIALLRRNDIDFAFATRNARDAAYPTRAARDRDYSKAGIAP